MNVSDFQKIDVLDDRKKYKNNSKLEDKKIMVKEIEKKEMETYLKMQDSVSTLELDLILMREKGQLVKFLEITFSGQNPETGQTQLSKKVIETKEEFEQLKQFVNQLDWENL